MLLQVQSYARFFLKKEKWKKKDDERRRKTMKDDEKWWKKIMWKVSDDKQNRLQLNSRMVMQFLQMRAVLLGYINRLNP